MKRKIFFWLEKLKITRAERYAITLLMIMLGGLVLVNAILKPTTPFSREDYKEIDRQFRRQTAILHQQEQKLLARYNPEQSPFSVADTIPDKLLPEGVTINVNTAEAKSLQKLPGIGPAFARRIINYREQNGPFKTKGDLLKIKGIGKATLQKMEPLITFGHEGRQKTVVVIADSASTANAEKQNSSNQTENKEPNIINVNAADAQTLQQLPGIGPAYADRIVTYRQQNGSFATKDELLKIKGIGKKRLAKIKPFIKLMDQ